MIKAHNYEILNFENHTLPDPEKDPATRLIAERLARGDDIQDPESLLDIPASSRASLAPTGEDGVDSEN